MEDVSIEVEHCIFTARGKDHKENEESRYVYERKLEKLPHLSPIPFSPIAWLDWSAWMYS